LESIVLHGSHGKIRCTTEGDGPRETRASGSDAVAVFADMAREMVNATLAMGAASGAWPPLATDTGQGVRSPARMGDRTPGGTPYWRAAGLAAGISGSIEATAPW